MLLISDEMIHMQQHAQVRPCQAVITKPQMLPPTPPLTPVIACSAVVAMLYQEISALYRCPQHSLFTALTFLLLLLVHLYILSLELSHH